MMRSLFGKILYQKRFMLLGWFIAIAGITFITMSVYNSFSNGAIGDSLQSLPPALQKIAGSADSFKTIDGFVSQQIFALRMPVLLIILSIALFVGLTAGEEQGGLVETQLSLPLKRSRLLREKLLAGFAVVLMASLGSLVGVGLGLLATHHTYNYFDMLPMLINCIMIALNFGLLGAAIASVTGLKAPALGVASALAFLSYLVNSMAPSVDYLKSVDRLTLFHYYGTSGGYHWGYLGVQVAVMAVLLAISFSEFTHRDIRAR